MTKLALLVVALVAAAPVAIACGGEEPTCEGDACTAQDGDARGDGQGGDETSRGPAIPAAPADPRVPPPSGEAGARSSSCRGTPSTCFCNTAFGGAEVASCGRATGATHCCRAAGDPAAAACTCTDQRPNCHRNAGGDRCSCNLAQPTPDQTEVGTCAAKAGGVCCVEGSALAPMCTCWDKLTACPSGRPVASCSLADLACEDGATSVDTCGG